MSISSMPSAQRIFLYSLIGSVLLSAVLVIVALLSGGFGWLEIRVVLTTTTIALASVCGLACGAGLRSGMGQVIPRAGIGLSVLAAAMIIAGLWIEMNLDGFRLRDCRAAVLPVGTTASQEGQRI